MGEKHFLLGIDIGTQGVKGALFDEQGSCISEASQKSQLLHPEAGAVTEDSEYQYASVLQVIRSCVDAGREKLGDTLVSRVASIAIDGQMAGIIGVGKDGRAVTPYDSWLDTRCADYVDRMRREAGEEVLKKAGTAPSFNHGPKILWWMHEHPEVFKKVHAFVQPGGYAAARLCGLPGDQAFIDRSYLHFSGFADTQAGKWDAELCANFNLPMEKLPRIVDSIDQIGTLSSEAAKECGLPSGIPVAAGCGDTVASFLSAGAVERGVCVDVAGTASVFACTLDEYTPDTESGVLGCCASADPGLWYSYAYINGGGMNPEWFVKMTGDSSGASRFKEIENAAEEICDSLTLPLYIPHMAGRVMPGRPRLKGAFAGITWQHEKHHLFWSLLEAVALEYGIYRKVVKTLKPKLNMKEIRVTGGGEKSSLWNTMKSGVLQTPVVRIQQNQGAPMGCAMIAGVCSGVLENLKKTCDAWVGTGEVIQCSYSRYGFFEKRLERYEALLGIMEEYTEAHPFSD